MGTGLLSDWQKLTQAEITRAGSRYIVLRFSDDGKVLFVQTLPAAQCRRFRAEKFLRKGK